MNESITTLLQTITKQLTLIYGSHEAAEHNAWWLIEKLLQKKRAEILMLPTVTLTQEQEQQLADWLEKITMQHMPLQYILGTVPFAGITLLVEPPVIIPRPETEYWCARLIEQLQQTTLPAPFRILDLCSGSGCIALALAHAFPTSRITAVDKEPAAINLARRNASLQKIPNVVFIQGDLYTALPHAASFDLIVSNPPYIDPADWQHLDKEVTQWEDKQGLVAEEQGYAIIKKILMQATQFLSPHAITLPQLWLEIGAAQGHVVQQLMKEYGFSKVTLMKDLSGKDRVVAGSL
jgi:release factor glutamine methyltransferase